MDQFLSRREIFRRAGLAVAALSTASSLTAVKAAEPGPVTARLRHYMADAAGRAVPAGVIEKVNTICSIRWPR